MDPLAAAGPVRQSRPTITVAITRSKVMDSFVVLKAPLNI